MAPTGDSNEEANTKVSWSNLEEAEADDLETSQPEPGYAFCEFCNSAIHAEARANEKFAESNDDEEEDAWAAAAGGSFT